MPDSGLLGHPVQDEVAMDALTFELLSGLVSKEGPVADERAVHGLIGRLSSALGFRYHAYAIITRLPLSRRMVWVKDGCPSGWMAHYQARRYYRVDPVLRQGLAGKSRMLWSDAMFSEAGALWSDARMAGLRYGMSLAAWDRTGALGLYSLARDAEPISAPEQGRISLHASWLMASCHPLLVAQLQRRDPRWRDVVLTPREREVLIWSADGKTAFEVAMIMGISERTVNFHLGHIISKFQASNKTQAIVAAVSSGLVSSW